jgi:hypothetical protein
MAKRCITAGLIAAIQMQRAQCAGTPGSNACSLPLVSLRHVSVSDERRLAAMPKSGVAVQHATSRCRGPHIRSFIAHVLRDSEGAPTSASYLGESILLLASERAPETRRVRMLPREGVRAGVRRVRMRALSACAGGMRGWVPRGASVRSCGHVRACAAVLAGGVRQRNGPGRTRPTDHGVTTVPAHAGLVLCRPREHQAVYIALLAAGRSTPRRGWTRGTTRSAAALLTCARQPQHLQLRRG